MPLYAGYDGKEKELSKATAYVESMPSLAQQQFKDDNDPNVIMKTFHRTQDLALFQKSNPQYGDFTGVNDLQTALNIVISASDAFDALPAHLRKRFDYDPVKFAEFLSDDANFDEAKSLGLLRDDAKSMSDAPRAEDLSTGLPAANKRQAGGPVGKSGEKAKASPRSSKSLLSDEGDEGDE